MKFTRYLLNQLTISHHDKESITSYGELCLDVLEEQQDKSPDLQALVEKLKT